MYDIKQTGFSCPQGSVYISESGEISLEYFEPIIHIESEEDIWELLDRAGYPVDQMILQRTEGGTYILFSAISDAFLLLWWNMILRIIGITIRIISG